MKKLFPLIFAFSIFALGCNEETYKPYAQIMPQHVEKVAVRPFINKTQIFSLEDKLTLALTDEFLRNGQYQVVREDAADGVVIGLITRYLMVPLQYDTQMIPTTYRLEVWVNVRFLDKKTDTVLWEEPALVSQYVYSASTLPGGMTEEQAREQVWDNLSKNIVTRTTEGFGSVWSQSRRVVQDNPGFNTITQ